ncbi:uncharacterized protein MYCFIDRAFT_78144 [Pseudocercospora fijiensis CIRAD86]|uniref:Uncharacterized protein n=1 Tax=Pseudocercospora fijiensis (strain CIRAD86) TaxID=383855 RepID=M3ASC0_PSEFD|nr:uncharacterized protein MYCFIDRAFT_78144 [Pseudocercospora fijiensis CIRAD86]EME80402.1 hypothetical protein MYCFIDRAFT_78144 [Pseudocercospora fijiensis CIRAD86]
MSMDVKPLGFSIAQENRRTMLELDNDRRTMNAIIKGIFLTKPSNPRKCSPLLQVQFRLCLFYLGISAYGTETQLESSVPAFATVGRSRRFPISKDCKCFPVHKTGSEAVKPVVVHDGFCSYEMDVQNGIFHAIALR